ncbi:MAG: hypothetical protein KDB44_09795, partial [Mycobacterium sp.]|nr:hypothetical protein [Mycobacterium sp.]
MEFETLASHIRMSVVPTLQAQMMALSDAWEGGGAEAARAEASALIDKHEGDATVADDIAKKLRSMEASVVRTKIHVNATAEQVQIDCEAIASDATLSSEARVALIEARIAEGLAENATAVSTNTAELAGNIEVASGLQGAAGNIADGGSPPVSSAINTHSMDEEFKAGSVAPSVNATGYATSVDG